MTSNVEAALAHQGIGDMEKLSIFALDYLKAYESALGNRELRPRGKNRHVVGLPDTSMRSHLAVVG